MARIIEITLYEMHEDTSAAQSRSVEVAGSWADVDLMEARVRGAQTDTGRRRDLDELQPDRLADL